MMRRIASTRSKYCSRVYLRFISFSIFVEPLCAGKWMCLQRLGSSATAYRMSSVMSSGFEVVKRTRMSGTL